MLVFLKIIFNSFLMIKSPLQRSFASQVDKKSILQNILMFTTHYEDITFKYFDRVLT